MSAQKLSCGVTQDLYDAYRALIPEGVALPTHLRGLVQAFVDGLPTPEVDMEALKAQWLAESAGKQPHILVEPATNEPVYTDPETLIQRQIAATPSAAAAFVGSGNTMTDTITRAGVEPGACLHPHMALVREGRFVRCTLCDQIVR